MTEKTTPHVFWAIVTIICFVISAGVILPAIPVICWVCSANNTKKHNAKVALQRHNELLAATKKAV
ncbi:hypothetical protein D3C87_325110 [compost metagenome]